MTPAAWVILTACGSVVLATACALLAAYNHKHRLRRRADREARKHWEQWR